jgi:hypothetical protein
MIFHKTSLMKKCVKCTQIESKMQKTRLFQNHSRLFDRFSKFVECEIDPFKKYEHIFTRPLISGQVPKILGGQRMIWLIRNVKNLKEFLEFLIICSNVNNFRIYRLITTLHLFDVKVHSFELNKTICSQFLLL